MHFYRSCKFASYLLHSAPSEDCLLIRKNTSLEIMKTMELKKCLVSSHVKNIVCKNMSQVRKITFKQIVSVLFQCFLKALD